MASTHFTELLNQPGLAQLPSRLSSLYRVISPSRFLFFVFTFLLLALPEQVSAQNLSGILIEGNRRIEDSTILLQISSSAGERYNARTVENDIKEIYRTGFFEQVEARLRRAPQGLVLVFAVEEKPAIREINIEGNDEISTNTVREKLDLPARRFLDRRKLEAAVEQLKDYYQTQGFYGTEVRFEVEEVYENQVDVTFRIDEGEERVIRKIAFEGNRGLEESELRDVLLTGEYRWWISWALGTGIVKKEQLEEDVRRLTQYYLTKGFVDVRVTEPVVEQIDNGLQVTYRIDEGERFRFGNISARGDLLDGSEEKTLAGTKSTSGEIFNVEHLRDDTFTISEKFTDIGFAFVNVDPLTQINRQNKTVNIDFTVNKGELITVDRILISGNEKTRDNVIRRSLRIHERELFSSSQIKRSQVLLQRLGYFDEVTITPEPSEKKDEVDLSVAVREGQTGTFTIGAGVSSGDGFIFSTRIAENNLFGSGNSLALDINSGTRRENYVLSFDNPRVSDSYWSLGVDLLSVEREFDRFDREQAGGSVRVGYPLWFLGQEYLDDVRFSLGYELLRINIDNVRDDAPQLVKDEAGKTTSSSVSPRLTRNTIDNPLDPTKGSRQVLDVELAGLGGDEEFWLFQASNTFYYPVWESPIGTFVFSQRTRFGYGETFNNDDFPLFRRFFPGGINSVRGYEARELGPKDEEGNEYGGSKQLIANFEIIFPLIPQIGLNGVTFYDIGNAFDDDESIDFNELRGAVGWGIRWRSPIAPIRVEIGYPLDREEGDKSVVTNFSFGAPL